MGKKLFLFMVIGCLLLGNLSVYAKEKAFEEIPQNKINVVSSESSSLNLTAEPLLAACIVGVGIVDNGLHVSFDTTATQRADEIGVKDIVIKEKTLLGWKEIPVSNYCTYNSNIYEGDIVYTGAVPGKTYYVECTHYAKFGSTELTLKNTSSELTYN